MSGPGAAAVVFGGLLVLFGLLTAAHQWRQRGRLLARAHVPSDEFAYLRKRYRRRLLTGLVLAVIGGMIAGAFASGMERQIDQLIEAKAAERQAAADPDTPRVEKTEEEMATARTLAQTWGAYWVAVFVLLFVALGLGFADLWATRRYAHAQYQHLREEHQTKLRRDLAVYKAQKAGRGGGSGGNRLGTGDAPPE